jgi:hypothetical protein
MSEDNAGSQRVAERRRKAVQLRIAGLNAGEILRQMSDEYGGSDDPAVVRVDIQRARELQQRLVVESVEELRDLQVDRLERLLAGVWKDAIKGDTKAADTSARLIERICKIRGLEPPTQVQLSARIEMESTAVAEAVIAAIDSLGFTPEVRMKALEAAHARLTAISVSPDEVV